jgi:hypothetical protein
MDRVGNKNLRVFNKGMIIKEPSSAKSASARHNQSSFKTVKLLYF